MSASESGTIAVLAEKPSVARDIARVLGAGKRGDGYLQGNGYVITWALGHLVSLAQPHEINPLWKQWRFDTLPLLPDRWPLVIYERSKDQFGVVQKILTSSRVSRIVCATDAGREGELIFRYIYEAAGCDKPVSRLWISSLTPEAIRKGFDNLRPGTDYDRLADAACGRSRADWLVGMNLSRAYSLLYNEDLSVGRVQTPTLAMVVDRELTLRNFVAEEYIEVLATFHVHGGKKDEQYQGTWFRPQAANDKDKEAQANASRLPADGVEAKEIIARARTGEARIESLTFETKRMQPPLLYDLTELQRHANRLFSFSAQKTLDLAQALYEKHKLISYPRTDSRYLSADVAVTLPKIVSVVSGRYKQHLAPETGQRPVSKRYVDDSKVSDHHAIIPTAVPPDSVRLAEDERKIYDLICRRMLMMWHDDHLQDVTTVITSITNEPIVDRYRTTGTVVQQMGWKVLDIAAEGKKKSAKGSEDEKAEQILPVTLAQGQVQDLLNIDAKKKKTRPPKRFTEGTLLTAMETAGKSLEEKELSDAMKETGLGTPATRAGIIEVLLKRAYIVRNGKTLEATDKGIHLIDVVHSEVKSPAMTGQWEAFLRRIQQGDSQLNLFLENINSYVRDVVTRVRQTTPRRKSPPPPAPADRAVSEPKPQKKKAPAASKLAKVLKQNFGFHTFPGEMEAACKAIVSGKDTLLATLPQAEMPLCYQVAGVVLGDSTIVFAPHSKESAAEVNKLKDAKLSAEYLHRDLDRENSRRVCSEYLHGNLQFLYIDPERLTVAGLPEMLAKKKPSLAVVKEAQRLIETDASNQEAYQKLSACLPMLRPATIVAIADTSVSSRQEEIVEKLKMEKPERFLHSQ